MGKIQLDQDRAAFEGEMAQGDNIIQKTSHENRKLPTEPKKRSGATEKHCHPHLSAQLLLMTLLLMTSDSLIYK